MRIMDCSFPTSLVLGPCDDPYKAAQDVLGHSEPIRPGRAWAVRIIAGVHSPRGTASIPGRP